MPQPAARLFAALLGVQIWRLNYAQTPHPPRHSGVQTWHFNYAHHGQDWREAHCASRERQSPIALSRKMMRQPVEEGKVLWYSYEPASGMFTFTNNGHSLAGDFAGQGYGGISYEQGWFNLQNVNFHAKSEHTFNGLHMPMELHLVHKQYDGGQLIVVAIPIDCESKPDIDLLPPKTADELRADPNTEKDQIRAVVDFPNPAFAQRSAAGSRLRGGTATRRGPWYPKNMPPYKPPDESEKNYNQFFKRFLEVDIPGSLQTRTSDENENDPVDFNALLEGGTYVEYGGSFTVPPCQESVTWLVRREPVMASDTQVRLLYQKLYQITDDFGNYRSPMPLNGRVVTIRRSSKGIPVLEKPIKEEFPPIPITRQFQAVTDAQKAMAVSVQNAELASELDDRIRRAAKAHADELVTSPIKGPPYNMSELIPNFPVPPGYLAPPCDTVLCKLSKMGDDMKLKIAKTSTHIVEDTTGKIAKMIHGTTVDAVRDYLIARTLPPPPTPLPPPYPTRGKPAPQVEAAQDAGLPPAVAPAAPAPAPAPIDDTQVVLADT